MNIRPIHNEADYDAALNRIDTLMNLDPEIGSVEGDELEILVMLVEKYEEIQWAIATPDPIEAIKYRMKEGAHATPFFRKGDPTEPKRGSGRPKKQ